ncbi:cupin domain-containing protein [Spirosoma sp. KUDC1026]|nr:cupin domain-containing protein [Spirosoma sp. KUDC1026]
MNRIEFLTLSGFGLLPFRLPMYTAIPDPEMYRFKDDGLIPNSTYPLLLYRKAFTDRGPAGALWLEEQFAANNWTNSWRNGVFPYHHYHSTTHEVLGIYSGSAQLQLGGEQGQAVTVKAGDIVVIPAGVGHKNLTSSSDFGVVGAYPDGRNFDVLRGRPGERPDADKRIAALPLPETDPLLGKTGGLVAFWK